MAARFDISVLGAPELSKALAELPEKLERRVITKAVRETGKFFLTLAKAKAPRDQGKLASTMKLRAMKRKKGRVGVRIMTGTRVELGIDPKDRGYYPAHVEFGHKDRSGNHVPAQPFFRGPLHSSREAMLAVMRVEIDNGIERELTRP